MSSAARNADGTRRFTPESNAIVESQQAHTCHVCRKPTAPGRVAHRIYSTRYAHVECAAKNPLRWHEDVTAACFDCRRSYPLDGMVVDPATADRDPNLQVRRCMGCDVRRGAA
jgi:hypothetical protein